MQVTVSCPECKFKITPEMKHTIQEGICPACGKKFEVKDLPSAFLVIDTIKELELPLNGKQTSALLDKLLKEKMEMDFPQIEIVETAAEKMRMAARREVPKVPTRDSQPG